MNTLRLGIDGNEANVANRVGSNHFAFQLIKALSERLGDKTDTTIYLKEKQLNDMPTSNSHWQYRVLTPQKLWTQWRLPLDLYLHRPRPDIFFSPGHYAPRFAPMPTLVTILDLAFLKFPNLFLKGKKGVAQLESWTRYSVKNATHLFTISENSKKDIVDAYNFSPDNISVIYPGIDLEVFKPATSHEKILVKQQLKLPPKFILYVGTIQPRKNLIRLLQAFEQLPSNYDEYGLVIAGQTGWLSQDFEAALARSPKKNQVTITGYVDSSLIPSLYASAVCLCLVGLYEGFGMPAAESLACGTIPVVSNNSSLPEVVGPNGITVDPYSVRDIRQGIMTAISLSGEARAKRLKLGREHISRFKWSNAAQTVEEVIYGISL